MNSQDNPTNTIWEEQQPGAFERSPESGQTGTSAEARNDVKSRALPAHGLSDRHNQRRAMGRQAGIQRMDRMKRIVSPAGHHATHSSAGGDP